jgi:hypothetical protein
MLLTAVLEPKDLVTFHLNQVLGSFRKVDQK